MAPGRCGSNSKSILFKLIILNNSLVIQCKSALRWMPHELTNGKSTLVQVMAWCHQAASHYLNQCWSRFMSPYGVTRPQWVNSLFRTADIGVHVDHISHVSIEKFLFSSILDFKHVHWNTVIRATFTWDTFFKVPYHRLFPMRCSEWIIRNKGTKLQDTKPLPEPILPNNKPRGNFTGNSQNIDLWYDSYIMI